MEQQQNDQQDDDDSVLELGQIAILGSSRASLRYHKSLTDMNASKRSLASRTTGGDVLASSRLLVNKFGSRTESIMEAAAAEEKQQQEEEEAEKAAAEEPPKPATLLDTCLFCFANFKGYYYGIISALVFVLSQVIMRRSIWLSGPDHVIIRLIIAFLMFFTYLKYKELPVLGPKHLFSLLVFRGFLGTVAIVTIYFAILFVDPSDVVSLTHTSLIMTAILGKIFLKEKLTMAHFFGILLTAAGVICITQPSFIFPKHNQNSSLLNSTDNGTTILCNITDNSTGCFQVALAENNPKTAKQRQQYEFGIMLTLIAAFLVSCTYLVIKKLAMCKVHWATNTLFVSLVGLPMSIVFSLILYNLGLSHKNFATQEKKDLPMDLFYSALAGFLSNVAQIFLNIALQYEDTTKIAITKTTDVFIAFVLQFILLNISPDWLSIIGACFILTATFFVLIYKMLNIKYDRWMLQKQIAFDEEQQQQGNKQIETPVISDVKSKILKKKSVKNFLLKIFFYQF